MEQFFCKTRIYTGAGAVAVLKDLHIKRLLLVSDPFFSKNGIARSVAEQACPEAFEIFDRVAPDPSVALAAEGAAAVRAFQPDTVVALGGGSAMDCAKAMAYFSGIYPKLVAIPTTSGSGSEVTDFAILTHDGIKHPLVDPALRPDAAILDSNLLRDLPPKLIAESGFDLICHALESWVATQAGSISRALAGDAFCTAMLLLPRSYGGDFSVRQKLHEAATMAGMAFSASGLGICHALSHSLGGEFHLPHGQLNGILLPAVIEGNSPVSGREYAALARRAGLSGGSDAVALRALKQALLRLRRSLRLPQTLAEAGISPAEVRKKADLCISAALEDACCHTNPVKPDRQMLQRILTEVTGHE